MLKGPLAAERLTLRRLEVGDAARISLLAGDWEVSRTLAAVPHPYDEAMARNWISPALRQGAAGATYHFAIERGADELVIGGIGLELANTAKAELGYWLGRPYWGQGYGAEAAGRVIEFGFDDLLLDGIVSAPLPTNAASIAILEKLGFTFQCREQQYFPARGENKEVMSFALSRADYAARNSNRNE